MSFLTLDIETVPQQRFLNPNAYNPLGPIGQHMDLDEKWMKDRSFEDAARLVEQGDGVLAATGVVPALHATTCHIVQVSFGWRQDNVSREIKTKLCQLDGYESEAELLTDALGVLASAVGKRTTIVSFNGKGFDVPVLRVRAALLGIHAPSIPWRRLLYPYSDDQHADLRLILGADDRRARGTLQWWCDAFAIHAEEHGAEVGAWVRAGEWDKLLAYGQTEAKTLIELFEAVEPVL